MTEDGCCMVSTCIYLGSYASLGAAPCDYGVSAIGLNTEFSSG